MLRALAHYVINYNPGMHDQLLRFEEEIQTKSLSYDWPFLRKWVSKVIKGLTTRSYDLDHIPTDTMICLLAKNQATRSTVAMAAANKLDAGPYASDVKEKTACAFHNKLKGEDRGCTKGAEDCKKRHICACCGKTGHIFWKCPGLTKKWSKKDQSKDKPLVTHNIVDIQTATRHNAALQRRYNTPTNDFSTIDKPSHYHPDSVVGNKLTSYKVGNFEEDEFDWGDLNFPKDSSTKKTEEACRKFGIKKSNFKPIIWQKYLQLHLNTNYTTWVVRSILQGAPLRFKKKKETVIVDNSSLTEESKIAIEQRIREEDQLGRSHIIGEKWPKKC